LLKIIIIIITEEVFKYWKKIFLIKNTVYISSYDTHKIIKKFYVKKKKRWVFFYNINLNN